MMRALGLTIALIALLLGARAEAQSVGMPPTASGIQYVGPLDVVASGTQYWGLRPASGIVASAGLSIINLCTALDALCGDVVATASGGLSLPPIGLCLTGCIIKTFYGQSASGLTGNNATQATAANQAGYSPSCTTGHSKSCAVFNGTSDSYTAGSSVTTSLPYTFLGFAETASASNKAILGVTALSTTGLQHSVGANQWYINSGSGLGATAADGSFHSGIGVVATGATGILGIDGAATTGTTGTLVGAITPCLGGSGSSCGSNLWSGDISEWGIWASTGFTAGQITSMNANQSAYW